MDSAILINKKINYWANEVQSNCGKIISLCGGNHDCYLIDCQSIDEFLRANITDAKPCKMPDYFVPVTEYDINKYALFCVRINDKSLVRPILSTFIGILNSIGK